WDGVSKRLIRLPDPAADAGEAFLRRVVIPGDVECLGVGAGGLFLFAHALVGEAAAGPGVHALRLELHGLVEVGRRRLGVAGRELAQAARDARLGLLRRQPDRGREVVDRELVLV